MVTWLVAGLAWFSAWVRWMRLPPDRRTGSTLATRVLEHTLIGCVGLLSLYYFIAHWFFSDWTAAYIGWPAGNPFQKEVALASLSFSALGLLCARYRDGFWTATTIGVAIFYLGAAYGHLVEMLTKGNYHPGNAGTPFYYDIVMPLVLIGSLVVRAHAKEGARPSEPS